MYIGVDYMIYVEHFWLASTDLWNEYAVQM